MRSTSRKLETGARIALKGLRLNAALCLVKIGVGLAGHSYAMIADGVESLLDVLSSLLTWGGLKYAQRPPDATHPYGHGKAEPMAAILGAVLILCAAVGLSVESILALKLPRPMPQWYTLGVLAMVVVVKARHSRSVKNLASETHSLAIEADAVHHTADAFTSAATLAGIGIALIGGNRYKYADNWAALVACAVIAYNGLRIFWPALSDLLDTAPPPEIEKQVRATAMRVEGVEGTDQCRVRKMGLEYYVDLHLKVNGDITVTEGHGIAHKVKDAVRQEVPEVADVLVHIEPAGGKKYVRQE
jgi:cation diffusion facilitator family transporter